MAATSQLNLPPMRVNGVGDAMPTDAKTLGTVNLAAHVLRAGDRLGMQRKEMAAIFDLSEADFSAAFSPNRPDRNRTMKQELPMVVAREIALALCEATGLAVAGPDAERHAIADLMAAAANYIRVMQR